MTEDLDPAEQLGDLPVSWNAVPAGSLFSFKNGLNYSASQSGTDRGVKVVGVADFANRFRFRPDGDLVRVDLPEGVDKSYLLQDSDLLFVRSNGNKELVGRVMFLDRVEEPVSHSGFTIRGRVTSSEVDPLFAAYFFNSALVKRQFLRLGGGTNISNLSQEILKAVVFPRPPLPEQRKVALVLSEWDRGIELVGNLINAKRQRKACLMQQLLTGRVRFRQFHRSNDRHHTAVGEMPVDWKSHKLASVTSKVKRKNTVGEGHVLTASGEHGLVDQREFFNRSVASADLSGYYLLKRGEFAYNRSAMNGYPFGAIKRLDRYDQGVLSTLYICFGLMDDGTADSDFMAHYFEARLLDRQLGEVTQVGGRAHGLLNITDADFYSMHVVLPGIEEQRKIAPVLNEQQREIEVLEQKLDALRRQKTGLMQQLLTGKKRVKVPAESLGD